jgi:hypothetical protein
VFERDRADEADDGFLGGENADTSNDPTDE